jgi:hypothetical protein
MFGPSWRRELPRIDGDRWSRQPELTRRRPHAAMDLPRSPSLLSSGAFWQAGGTVV